MAQVPMKISFLSKKEIDFIYDLAAQSYTDGWAGAKLDRLMAILYNQEDQARKFAQQGHHLIEEFSELIKEPDVTSSQK